MDFEEWYDQHFGSADPNVVKAGNIDLGDRPAVYNKDGSVSTERSFSIGDKYGRETLLPQVVGGRMLSKKDAIQHYKDTGEHLGIYKDIPTANAYAKSIHERIPRLDTPDTFPVGNVMQSIRDLPGWAAYRMYRGATRTDLPGEGPSAREQEAAGVVPPPYMNRGSFSVDNARANLRDIKNAILPPGFSVQRGLDSALAPAKWLFNEVRQGVLPDEALQEIKRDPYSPESLAAYAQAAISLSGGKGGPGERGAVPEHIWNSWKPLPKETGKTYIVGQGGEIRTDPAGNHYQIEGTHHDKTTGQTHVVIKPVEPPGSGTSMSPEDALDLLNQLHSNPEAAPFSPTNPEPGSVLDLWSKKHGGLVPTPGAPSSGAPPPPIEPPNLTPYNPRIPPNIDPLDSMLSEWAKFMDQKGIDYQKQVNPPPEDLFPWEQPPEAPQNRFNWKPPPEHGGNNL